MPSRLHRRSVAAVGLLIAASVPAQPAPPPGRPDPLDAAAPVPPVLHRSTLGAYRPAHEVAVGSWKDANDAVARIGGWRTYLREAQAPAPSAGASSPAPPAPPASSGRPGGRHGDGGHGGGHGRP
jgi:hypothetical protein